MRLGIDGFVPAAGAPAVGRLSFFEGIAARERQAFHQFPLLVGEFGPEFHSSFIAAWASLCGVHLKYFFPKC